MKKIILFAAVVMITAFGMAGADAAVRCGGPCPTYPTTTQPTTTMATTTIATTTTKAQETTTTTVPATTTTANRGFCQPDPQFPNKVCLNFSDPTTVPAPTTTAAPPTTVAPPPVAETTAVDQTLAPVPPVDEFVPTTVPQELPHTGFNPWVYVAVALLMGAAGFGLSAASRRRHA
jgi:LPXTG-motif cell wall-anchored protein